MGERIARRPARSSDQPRLLPEECSQRAAGIAVDMCTMNVQYMNTLSQFLPLGELFHVQMHLLYGLIDTMGATANVDPETVIEIAGKYFKSLRDERTEMSEKP
jgi:hypothetical protein